MPFAAPILGDRRVLAIGLFVAFLASITIYAAIGGPHGAVEGLSWMLMLLGKAGAAPAAYLVASIGWGRLARPLLRDAEDPWALQAAIGIGIMLSLSHGLGVARLFGGPSGQAVAVGAVVVGIALLAQQIVAVGARTVTMVLPWTALPGLIGLALMLVAACSPPGWLWDSEYGGFDALAYHLELPQEWLARGWLWPAGHNVYSYLPSYVESAYLHLAVFRGGAAAPSDASPMIGLLSGDGSGVLSCQLLHVGLTLAAGLLVARATRVAAIRSGVSGAAAVGAGVAASLFLLTPWTVVVGSLAYNEAGVTALGAGAMLSAMDDRLSPSRRGLISGLLVGLACGAKPTALTMIGVPVGVALLALAPARDWWRLAVFGAIAGAASLFPWLLRNWYASGNPVFPFGAGLFGTGHWTPEQVERYLGAHRFGGSIGDALRLMVLPERADGASNHRGMLHPQWFAFFPLCLAAAVGVIAHPGTRRIGVVLGAGIALQVLVWLTTTHIQSRFLVPVTVTGAMTCGLAAAAWWPARAGAERIGARSRGAGLAAMLLVAGTVAQGIAASVVFARQRGGMPNALLINTELGGVNTMSAEAVGAARGALAAMPESERRQTIEGLAPLQFVDFALPTRARVYLLGDSAVLYFRPPFVAHSTYDASPLGVAMRAAPGQPALWSSRLRAEGIELVMVNFSELDRLRRSGWYDPLVTPQAVTEWLEAEGRLIRSWPTGQAIFRLAPRDDARRGPEGAP